MEHKFKVGDKVEVGSDGGCYATDVGKIFTVTSVVNLPEHMNFFCAEDDRARAHQKFELAWQPTNGEEIEVRDEDGEEWNKEVFIGMDEGAYITKDNCEYYTPWEQARKIATHTITIDGTDVVLSKESFQAFKKQFNT